MGTEFNSLPRYVCQFIYRLGDSWRRIAMLCWLHLNLIVG